MISGADSLSFTSNRHEQALCFCVIWYFGTKTLILSFHQVWQKASNLPSARNQSFVLLFYFYSLDFNPFWPNFWIKEKIEAASLYFLFRFKIWGDRQKSFPVHFISTFFPPPRFRRICCLPISRRFKAPTLFSNYSHFEKRKGSQKLFMVKNEEIENSALSKLNTP